MTEQQIRRELTKLSERGDELRALLDGKLSQKRVRCSHCGRATMVSKLIYLQTHWYVRPYGCTGGDYWKEGEGQFECPKCGRVNRLYNRPEVVKLKRFFQEVRDTHD